MRHRYDLGYPLNFGDPHFGLYNPVLDCFLITVRNLAGAREIQHLASSRYDLYLTDLVPAVNYAPNFIDNKCCHAWSMVNDQPLPLGDRQKLDIVLEVKKLVPVHHSDLDIEQEKIWLQVMLYWRSFVRWIKTDQIHYDRYRLLKSFIGTDFLQVWQAVDEFDRMSLERLYLGTDTREINRSITAIVNAGDFLRLAYQKWKKQEVYCS